MGGTDHVKVSHDLLGPPIKKYIKLRIYANSMLTELFTNNFLNSVCYKCKFQ